MHFTCRAIKLPYITCFGRPTFIKWANIPRLENSYPPDVTASGDCPENRIKGERSFKGVFSYSLRSCICSLCVQSVTNPTLPRLFPAWYLRRAGIETLQFMILKASLLVKWTVIFYD